MRPSAVLRHTLTDFTEKETDQIFMNGGDSVGAALCGGFGTRCMMSTFIIHNIIRRGPKPLGGNMNAVKEAPYVKLEGDDMMKAARHNINSAYGYLPIQEAPA